MQVFYSASAYGTVSWSCQRITASAYAITSFSLAADSVSAYAAVSFGPASGLLQYAENWRTCAFTPAQ